MSTVPAPRGSEAGTGSDSYLVRGFEQLRVSVETGFRELREQMSSFVTQREFDREQSDRKEADKDIADRVDDIEKSATAFRRWVITASIAAASAAGAIGSVVENALQHH